MITLITYLIRDIRMIQGFLSKLQHDKVLTGLGYQHLLRCMSRLKVIIAPIC